MPDSKFHPLDRPVWSALTTRQEKHARGDASRALRFDPEIGPFAVAAENTDANLAGFGELIAPGGFLAVFEREHVDAPSGLVTMAEIPLFQMVTARINPGPELPGIVALGEDDAPQMRELAGLTQPGPFFSRTHELGGFVGIKENGKLIAMAGQRLSLPGFTEVSAVCTHADHRGKGMAAALMRVVGGNIAARGDAMFLHARVTNTNAIALYEKLGFVTRAQMLFHMIRRE